MNENLFVPTAFLVREDLTPIEKVVFLTLRAESQKRKNKQSLQMSMESLAKIMGMSRRTLQRYISNLEEKGGVVKQFCHDQYGANVYNFFFIANISDDGSFVPLEIGVSA